MDKSTIIAAAKEALCKHSMKTFVSNPPSIAEGGNGVVVPGCPLCKVRLNTDSDFVRHLATDVLPQIIAAIPGINVDLRSAQGELCRHGWDVFTDARPDKPKCSILGCRTCMKEIRSQQDFMKHLSGVLQGIIETSLAVLDPIHKSFTLSD